MPPKKNNSAKGKSAKNREEDENFDQLLSQLKKATRDNHKNDPKARKAEEAAQAEVAERRLARLNAPSPFLQQMEREQKQRALHELFERMMAANRPFLNAPATEVTTDVLEGKSVGGKKLVGSIAVAEMQGWRSSMEDAHCTELKLFDDAAFFAVFDGHAGDQCGKQSKVLLPALVLKHRQADQTNPINFREAYHELDAALRGRLKDDSGCTAVSVFVTESVVSCANVGDSRAVLARRGANGSFETVALSDDHKPQLDYERARIEEAGGKVESDRVNGMLAMSRAIGDYSYKAQEDRAVDKQLVIPTPDVTTVPRSANDAFLVLACDGIFDVLSNEELVASVAQKIAAQREVEKTAADAQLSKEGVAKVCEKVCRECLAPASLENQGPIRSAGTDNMTIMIVLL